jgi:hypothetical protein
MRVSPTSRYAVDRGDRQAARHFGARPIIVGKQGHTSFKGLKLI